MYTYYAKRKKDIAKRIRKDEVSPEALRDEGYYTITDIDIIIENKTIKEIEKIVKKKAIPPKRWRIGRKNKRGLVL